MSSGASRLPQRLNYLDLQAEASPPYYAMVNQGSRTGSRLGFDDFKDTNPMQMQLADAKQEDMYTPFGSLENLLGSDAFASLQLATPTKQKPVSSNSNNGDEIVNHSVTHSSGCSTSSPDRETAMQEDERADSALSRTSLSERTRSNTNFTGMSMSATLSMEERRRLTIEETADRIAQTAFVPFAHSVRSASMVRSDVSYAKSDNRSAGRVRRHDDSDEGE